MLGSAGLGCGGSDGVCDVDLTYRVDVFGPRASGACPQVVSVSHRIDGPGAESGCATAQAQPVVVLYRSQARRATRSPDGTRYEASISREELYWGRYWGACPGCLGHAWIELRAASPARPEEALRFCTTPTGDFAADTVNLVRGAFLSEAIAPPACPDAYFETFAGFTVPAR